MNQEEICSRTVKYLEKCEEKLFECFQRECDAGLYHKADEIVSLLGRLDII